MNTPKLFAETLAQVRLPSVFNPYVECCELHDRRDGPRVRKRNLIRFLEAAIDARVDTLWIARDLGYRGGRRTGIPLTDEVHLSRAAAMLGGISLDRATSGPPVAERTAAIIWTVLSRINEPAMLWNVFPFHPYEGANPLSNRCHTRQERETTWPLLLALISMLKPRRIVAIGRDASIALNSLSIPVETVRHPSYGGQAEFVAGINAIYGLPATVKPTMLELPLDGDCVAPKAKLS